MRAAFAEIIKQSESALITARTSHKMSPSASENRRDLLRICCFCGFGEHENPKPSQKEKSSRFAGGEVGRSKTKKKIVLMLLKLLRKL